MTAVLGLVLDQRTVLLFGHVAGAILLFGPLTAAASRFPAVVVASGSTPAGVAVARELHRTTRTYGTASAVVPVLGVVLALRSHVIGALWVQLSLGLIVIAAGLMFGIVVPEQSRLIELLGSVSASDVGRADVARLRAVTGLFALVWVVVVFLMIAKPL